MQNVEKFSAPSLSASVALMEHEAKRQVVRDCFEAYRTGDRSMIEKLIAPDMRFTSPQDDAIDRAEYFRRCWPNHEIMETNAVEQVFVEGEHAYVTYRITMKNGREFWNTEYMTVRDGQIVETVVFFGPTYRDGKMVMPEDVKA